ncbi:hypothetical protein STEG23_010667 [Scotinomys teguina]
MSAPSALPRRSSELVLSVNTVWNSFSMYDNRGIIKAFSPQHASMPTTQFLSEARRVTMYPLERAMRPMKMASLEVNSILDECFMGTREQDSVRGSRFISQHPHGSPKPPEEPVPRDPKATSEVHRHQACFTGAGAASYWVFIHNFLIARVNEMDQQVKPDVLGLITGNGRTDSYKLFSDLHDNERNKGRRKDGKLDIALEQSSSLSLNKVIFELLTPDFSSFQDTHPVSYISYMCGSCFCCKPES